MSNGRSATERRFLRFPVVSAGAEHLVMGYLMRRNILTYKAPPGNEGYDLICIHPDPRHKRKGRQKAQVRVQVKSRYQTDCNRAFLVKEKTLDAFDFLIVVFQNIGNFYRKRGGDASVKPPEFYTLPNRFIRQHHDKSTSWEKVYLGGSGSKVERYRDDKGFELVAKALGVPRPQKRGVTAGSGS